MRRGSGCAFILVVLCACIPITGCGGSSTTKLAVTTTSLPNGIVGAPYTATLTAVGGTPPYTWSQSSGGAMPAGVTVGSSGIFSGTPTAPGMFGPYVFNATDSNSLVASSVSLTITVTANPLAVTTSTLPQGTVGSPYSVTLAASGGTPPYTWTEASGGALPPGLADITSGGVIAGTPTMPGSYGPYVFMVTDSTKASANSSSLMITINSQPAAACTPQGNEEALNSNTPYAFLVKGTDGSGNPIDIAGSFTPNGSGGISNATVDYNGFTNGPDQLQVNLAASSYSFSSSQQGCLSLGFSGPVAGGARRPGVMSHLPNAAVVRAANGKAHPAIASTASSVLFAFSMSGFDGTVYHTGRIIESDTATSGTSASGSLHLQDPTAFSLTALQSNFAFGADGWASETNGLARTAIAGAFTNSSGTLTAGYADLNTGGTPSGELTGGSGTLVSTINPATGRGKGTYIIPTGAGNFTIDFAYYILNATDMLLISTDPPITVGSTPLLAGRALASSATYPAGALNGYYLLASQGLDLSGGKPANLAVIGTFNATSAGAIPAATLYANDAGSFSTTPFTNGSYTTEAASGRVSTTGFEVAPPVVYLTAAGSVDDQIAGFLVGTDTDASSGVIVSQSATTPAYGLSSVSGNYAQGTQEDVDGLNGATLGAFTFTGAGGYTATLTTTGTVPNLPTSGSIAIHSDGSGSLNGGTFPLVTNGSVVFAIPDTGDPLLYVFTVGTQPK